MRYWLVKTEPDSFSIDDLVAAPNKTTMWDGVRNYQARNFMRDDMKKEENVLFYHSGSQPSVVGVAKVVSEPYPDPTQWDPDSKYFDPKSSSDKPRWILVDIKLVRKFSRGIPLQELRSINGLENMELLRKGSRLSVQPVSKEEFEIITSIE